MNVSLFITCLADQLYPSVGVATTTLLQKLGCKVVFPTAQVCCGQPAFNSGFRDEARAVARRLLEAFEAADYVVSPSGSCSSMIHHYYGELFGADDSHAERARALAAKTFELSQFVVRVLKVADVGASFPHRVTYHPSCHGSRLLGVREEPLILLGQVRDLDLAPLPRKEDCCGFGGTFAVKLSNLSAAMVQEKVEHIRETKAEFVVGTDMGCLMNIAGRLSRQQSPVLAIHLAELLTRNLDS